LKLPAKLLDEVGTQIAISVHRNGRPAVVCPGQVVSTLAAAFNDFDTGTTEFANQFPTFQVLL
jgi:hypothetical protein